MPPVQERLTSTCEALYGMSYDDAETCGRPGAEFIVLGCIHEHMERMYICSRCRACIKCLDCATTGHECLMGVLDDR